MSKLQFLLISIVVSTSIYAVLAYNYLISSRDPDCFVLIDSFIDNRIAVKKKFDDGNAFLQDGQIDNAQIVTEQAMDQLTQQRIPPCSYLIYTAYMDTEISLYLFLEATYQLRKNEVQSAESKIKQATDKMDAGTRKIELYELNERNHK